MLPLVGVLAGAAFLAWRAGLFALHDRDDLVRAIRRVDDMPWLGPSFVAVFAGLAAAALPITPLALAGGALFGLVRGGIFTVLGALLGATASYWLARTSIGGLAKRLLARRAARLASLGETRGFLAVMRIQLVPAIPFGLFNLTAGATRIPFWPFLAGTAVGILPGTLALVWAGERLMTGVRDAEHRATWTAVAIAGGLMALSFVPTIVKKVRAA